MSTTSWVLALIAAIIIGLGAWWYTAKAPTVPVAPASNTDQGMPDTGVVTLLTAPKTITVTYGPNGFSPSNITIAKGDTVTFTAAPGANQIWVASAPHPAHTGYDGTDRATHCAADYTGAKPFDQCSAGNTFSFTFT